MKAAEFAYWMQGYFEINGDGRSLTENQALLVLKKAESVKAGSDAVEGKAQSSVSFAQGMLFPVSEGMVDEAFLKSASQKMKNKLHDLFAHTIDPSYEGAQSDFNAIHEGGRPPRPVMRC